MSAIAGMTTLEVNHAMEMAPQMLEKAQFDDGNGGAAARESDDAAGVGGE
jgi:hypothetical protein